MSGHNNTVVASKIAENRTVAKRLPLVTVEPIKYKWYSLSLYSRPTFQLSIERITDTVYSVAIYKFRSNQPITKTTIAVCETDAAEIEDRCSAIGSVAIITDLFPADLAAIVCRRMAL